VARAGPCFICTTGGVFAVSRPVFASKAELEDLVGAQVGTNTKRLVVGDDGVGLRAGRITC